MGEGGVMGSGSIPSDLSEKTEIHCMIKDPEIVLAFPSASFSLVHFIYLTSKGASKQHF